MPSRDIYAIRPGSSHRSFYKSMTWERGSDRTTPRPFHMDTISCSISDAGSLSVGSHLILGFNGTETNEALQRLNEAMHASSELGSTIAQGKDALSMIRMRSAMLLKAARHLRKGRLGDFAKTLRVNPKAKHRTLTPRTVSKNSGSLWLEYWFGWAPLLADINNSARVLVQDLPAARLRGRAQRIEDWSYSVGSDEEFYREKAVFTFRAQVGADVYVGDSDEFLAARLGLNDPLAIAWELVPVSWLVDWFIPVGDAISSFNLFKGVTLKNVYYTKYSSFTGIQEARTGHWSPSGITYLNDNGVFSGARVDRKINLPSYFYNFRPHFPHLSVTRAATAISLLVQGLQDLKR